MDVIRTRIKALNGGEFVALDVKEGDDDRNFHVRVSTLLKNGEIMSVGKVKNRGQTVTRYRESELREIGLSNRVPFHKSPTENSPWEGTWLEVPVPPTYLAGKKTVHYGLSRSGDDDDE